METANEKILSEFIKHRIFLIQYAEGLTNQAVKSLRKDEDELRKLITFYSMQLEGESIASKSAKKSLASLKRELTAMRRKSWKDASKLIVGDMNDLIHVESDFVAKTLTDSIPVQVRVNKPTRTALKDSADNLIVQGQLLEEWLDDASRNDVDRIMRRVRVGTTQNQSAADLVRGVMGTARFRYRDGAVQKGWKDTQTLALTSTITTATNATTEVVNKNTFMITREYFVATLDARTSPICMSEDGNVYKLNEGAYPPLHMNCRSIRLPYINGNSIADRSFDPTTERMLVSEYKKANSLEHRGGGRQHLPSGHKGRFDSFSRQRKRDLIGRVPEKLTYERWLRRQPAQFQNERLGTTRAKLFRKHKLPLDRFVNRNGDFLTLEQLRKKGIE